jgi:hypothetical protein
MNMMVLNKVPGADFSEYGMGQKLPAGDRCVLWHEFGVSDRLSLRNHANAGSRGHLVAGTVVGAAGISAGAFISNIANDYATGDATLIAFVLPGSTGTSFQVVADIGGSEYASQATNEVTPLRYGSCIRLRVNNPGTAPYDFLGQYGTYDATTPTAAGVNNSLSKTNAAIEAMSVTQEFVAATRVQTLTLRNAATYATPASVTNTAAANHIRDNRTTLPFELRLSGGTMAYSLMAFNRLLTIAEKNAIYAQEAARLTALGVTNL